MARCASWIRGIFILRLSGAVAVAGSQLFVPQPAALASAPPGCPEEVTAPMPAVQCIAETPLSTRNRLAPSCFSQRELTPNALYNIGDCISANTIQAEAIGQARAIMRFNRD